jgi:hypothetical protein
MEDQNSIVADSAGLNESGLLNEQNNEDSQINVPEVEEPDFAEP